MECQCNQSLCREQLTFILPSFSPVRSIVHVFFFNSCQNPALNTAALAQTHSQVMSRHELEDFQDNRGSFEDLNVSNPISMMRAACSFQSQFCLGNQIRDEFSEYLGCSSHFRMSHWTSCAFLTVMHVR
jgi:hypothetical protein